jgi:plasmid stabilization system protein ParE
VSRYIFSPEARQDLIDIWDYIAQDNPAAATRVVDAIEAAVKKLADMPRMGHQREELGNDALRVWCVHSHLIIYDPEHRPLRVVRIVSGHRDIARIFD